MLALAGIKAGAEIFEGYQAKEAAEYNADLLRKNAEFQKNAAFDQSVKLQQQGAAFIGSQKTAIAGSGIKLNEGSPLEILKKSQKNLNVDVGRIRTQGINAELLGLNQATQLEKQGLNAFTGSILGAGSGFLSSVGQMGLDYKWWGPES